MSIINIYTQYLPSYRYDYDAAGNRTMRRYMIVHYPKMAANDNYNAQAGDYGITVFPNPAKSYLELKISNLKKDTKASLKIYDFDGNQVFEMSKVESDNTINISKFTNGVYIMEIIIDGLRSNWKIIKSE